MRPLLLGAALLTAVSLCPAAPVAATSPLAHAGEMAASACLIRYWLEARQRYPGYDHLVHIHNGCRMSVQCSVTTNVNPKTIRTSVPAGARKAVVTYRGSPAPKFTASVYCRPSR